MENISVNVAKGEEDRLDALRSLRILDTPPDGTFDRIVSLAAKLFHVPIAIVSLVDHDRIWFKAKHGLDIDQIDREPGLCASAILGDGPYILNDTKLDPRSLSNPLVAGDFGLRFYAAVPLETPYGHKLGTLCVLDMEPREMSDEEVSLLQELANLVMDQMQLRLEARRVSEEVAELSKETREQAEKLGEAERRLAAVLDNASVAIFLMDELQHCSYMNAAAEMLTGYTLEETRGRPLHDVLHHTHLDGTPFPIEDCPIDRAFPEHKNMSGEEVFVHKDGSFYPVAFMASPIHDEKSRTVGTIIEVRDITDEKRAEEALNSSIVDLATERQALSVLNETGSKIAAELDLSNVVQLVVDAGVALSDARFGAFFYNVLTEEGDRLFLYSLAGAEIADFEGFGMPRATKVFAPTFNAEGVIRSEDITKDPRYGKNAPHLGMPKGHLPVRSYLAVPVVSRSGEVIGGLFFGHPEPDIFDERAERLIKGLAGQAAIAIDNARLFQARERAQATLEERVRERTDELAKANEALRQAQKMEAIGQLTGGIAHDFNNLLQVIGGNLQLLKQDPINNSLNTARINNAISGVERGANLASQLLAFGRQQPLNPKPTNAARIVRDMDDMFRRTLGEAVEIETIVAAGLWNCLVDPRQLENVLLNLAINARDAMKGEGKLTVEAGNASLDEHYVASHPDAAEGQYVVIAVTDTGCGISAENLSKVFEPFFTTKAPGEGTGLGLSMVFGFVKQTGGHITIYSEEGEGTTVRIYLPRTRKAEMANRPEGGLVSEPGNNEVILVVEDDEDVRATAVEMLTNLGYKVIEAANADSALAIIQCGITIDLLFTDVVMPGKLRSPELARLAKERMPNLAVLFTSGYTQNAIVHAGKLDEGIDLISKPYSSERLSQKIRKALKKNAVNQDKIPKESIEINRDSNIADPNNDSDRNSTGALSVLVIEDEPLIRMTLVDILEALACKTFEAGTLSEARQLVAANDLDVVIADLSLPDGKATEFLLETMKNNPDTKTILATGGLIPDELQSQGISVLAKPFSASDLKKILNF